MLNTYVIHMIICLVTILPLARGTIKPLLEKQAQVVPDTAPPDPQAYLAEVESVSRESGRVAIKLQTLFGKFEVNYEDFKEQDPPHEGEVIDWVDYLKDMHKLFPNVLDHSGLRMHAAYGRVTVQGFQVGEGLRIGFYLGSEKINRKHRMPDLFSVRLLPKRQFNIPSELDLILRTFGVYFKGYLRTGLTLELVHPVPAINRGEGLCKRIVYVMEPLAIETLDRDMAK